ncbi:MAG: PDZ domain-containing protein [Bacteroidota bacterium]|nr:PDZ domain-containing protein [Bacteroidota bacterium]
MKNFMLLFVCFTCMSPFIFSQEKENQEKSEKKIIVKSIIVDDASGMSEQELEIFIDSITSSEMQKARGTDVQVNVIVKEDDSFHNNGRGEGYNFKWEAKEWEANKNRPQELFTGSPNKAVMGVQIDNAGGDNGASISQIYKESAAEKAGLRVGDIIQKINKQQIANIEELIKALSDRKSGDEIKVGYMRGGKSASVNLKLQERKEEMVVHEFKSIGEGKCPPSCKGDHKICTPGEKEMLRIYKDKKGKEEKINKIEIEKKEQLKQGAGRNSQSLEIEYLHSYPNPNQGVLKVRFQGNKVPTKVKIVDLAGKEIYSENLESFDGNYKKDINLSDVKGTVILIIIQGEKIISQKIVVE